MREIRDPLYSKVADLEDDILKLKTLGDLLMTIGTPRVQVSAEVVSLVGGYVHETVVSLKADWNSIRVEMGGRP